MTAPRAVARSTGNPTSRDGEQIIKGIHLSTVQAEDERLGAFLGKIGVIRWEAPHSAFGQQTGEPVLVHHEGQGLQPDIVSRIEVISLVLA